MKLLAVKLCVVPNLASSGQCLQMCAHKVIDIHHVDK